MRMGRGGGFRGRRRAPRGLNGRLAKGPCTAHCGHSRRGEIDIADGHCLCSMTGLLLTR